MALVIKDRVRQTSTTAGTGTITLSGSVSGYQDFSVIGSGNTTYYTIADESGSNWEVGLGTYTSPNQLARTTVYESSNSNNLVNFGSNTKDVFVTLPAEAVGGSGITGSGTTNYVSKFTSGSVIGDSVIYDNGTNVGIGTNTPAAKLDVNGGVLARAFNATNTPVAFESAGGTVLAYNGSGDGVLRAYANNAGTGGQLLFYSGGSERMRLDSSGNVGIGTSSPTNNTGYAGLSMNGSSGAVISLWQGNTETFRVTNATGYSFINTTGSTPLLFGTQALERMRIDLSGNVGIGTNSPSYNLDVVGSARISNFGYIGSAGSGTGGNWRYINDAGTTQWTAGILGSVGETSYAIYNNVTGTSALTINTSGNVGIGTSSPGYRLTATGASTAGSVTALAIENPSTNAASEVRQEWRAGGASYAYITSSYNTNQPYLAFGVSSSSSSPTERMRIDSSGNVGIGVIPSSNTTYPGLFLEYSVGLIPYNGDGWLTYNTYTTGSGQLKYINSGYKAAAYEFNQAGEHNWYTAGTGTANAAISFTQVMKIDSSGNLGIGTSSPTVPLTIERSTYFPKMGFLRTGIGTWYVGGDNAGTDNDFHININATTNFFTIDTTGNVGIGTSTPSAKLDVAGNVTLGSAATDTITVKGQLSANGSVGVAGQVLQSLGANYPPTWVNGITGSGTTGYIPRFSNTTTLSNSIIQDYGNRIEVNATDSGGYNFSLYTPSSSYGFLHTDGSRAFTTYVDGNGVYVGALSSDPLIIIQSDTEVMRIDTYQNVGIGTSTPTAKLDVNGSIATNTQALFYNSTVPTNDGWGVIECVDDGIGDGYNDLNIYAIDQFGTKYQPFFNAGIASADFVIRSQDWTTNYHYIKFNTPSGMTGDYTLTFPPDAGSANQVLQTDGTGTTSWVTPSAGGISGSGTTDYVPKFTSSGAIGNSLIQDDGTHVGVNGLTSYPFGVCTTGSSYGFAHADGVNGRYFATYLDSSGVWVGADSNDPLILMQNGAEAMRIDTSHNVGIGTSSPTAVLHLKAGTATANTAPLKLTSGVNLTTAEAGAVEYNGTAAFITGTAASGQGVILAPQIVRVNTDRAKTTNNTTLEAVFDAANDTLTLAGNTLYYFKGVYIVTKSATASAGNINVGFAFSNLQQDIGYKSIAYSTGLGTGQYSAYATSASSNQVTNGSSTASIDYVVEIEGWFKSNATTGGTLIPQFSQTVVGTTVAPTMKANSWFMVQPMSSNVSATIVAGNWT